MSDSTDAALAELRRRLVRLAVKLVWNRDDAEELVQEAFRLALKKGPAVGDGRFEPWLWRTVGHLCANHRRRKRPEPLRAWMDAPGPASPFDPIDRAAELERLRAAVAELPEQQRLALVLRTMEQMAYERIAEIMQVSAAAVRTHVHLARQRLAERLAPSQSAEGQQ